MTRHICWKIIYWRNICHLFEHLEIYLLERLMQITSKLEVNFMEWILP